MVYSNDVPQTPAMQSLLLFEVRRLQVAPSQHCAAMGTSPLGAVFISLTPATGGAVVAVGSCTHAGVGIDDPWRISTPCAGKAEAAGGECGKGGGGDGAGGGGDGDGAGGGSGQSRDVHTQWWLYMQPWL